MKFIWVFHAKQIKQLSLIIMAAFFTAGLLYAERTQLAVFSTPDGPQAFYKAETNDKDIAITFNISWGENRVLPILDVLEQKKVEHATFFVSATWAERYPDLVKEIQERGHTIGSHGYQYKDYTSWEDEKVRKDINRSGQVLSELIGERPTLLRPPNGSFNARTLQIAEAQGYSIVHWSIDSKDYQNPGVDAIVNAVVPLTSSGDVLLFHASDSVTQTHKALPIIIDQLRAKGFTFSSVDDLIASTKSTNKEIK
ncbi:polysaccharide deacetylase family sporulation protein PdaB [Halalkalibacter nanhaiisediminis]|uniref:Polysaccharide deacetylase family sporulation protein PdaB n=1 Tax=Halalkalibacter nanhaiisediminis TaxID=688079 RepID=A0A562QAB3_9BACI|nr:polysaccharide deacetylase family sporulation protein PdaB [Halalkalibacter nanhaiisediminis]TWI53663.1 polysaccharide deacetylase family sporulation protein PdaB [Halalkalibacter nanhaiisediminis]